MAEEEGKKEEKLDFTLSGEALGYVSLDQAVIEARRLARQDQDRYLRRLGWDEIVWSEGSSEQREDSYRVVLRFRRPARGVREEQTGEEEFLFDLTGSLQDRQVLIWPEETVDAGDPISTTSVPPVPASEIPDEAPPPPEEAEPTADVAGLHPPLPPPSEPSAAPVFEPPDQSEPPGPSMAFPTEPASVTRRVLSIPGKGRRPPVIPAAIGMVVVGVIAAVAALFAIGGDDGGGNGPARPTPTRAAAATATTAPAATATPTTAPAAGAALEISVSGRNLKFDKDKLTASAGSEVVLTFNNGSDVSQHNWVLVKNGTKDDVAARGTGAGPTNDWVQPGDADVIAHTKLVNPGETGEVTFTAPAAGVYQYACTFPGHNFTMFGTFEVGG